MPACRQAGNRTPAGGIFKQIFTFIAKIMTAHYITALSILFLSCKQEMQFQPLNYDGTKDIIGQMAAEFEPSEQYDYWALLCSGVPTPESVDVLYQSNNKFDATKLKPLHDCFFGAGFSCYYIVTIKSGNINFITTKEMFLDFLGEINSKSEALLITYMDEFGIDTHDPRGGSYKSTDKGYEFLLMKNAIPFQLIFRQYWVQVDRNGNVISKEGEIYCSGYEDCYE